MTAPLYADLGAQVFVEDDFSELRWLRVLAPSPAPQQMIVNLLVPAGGLLKTTAASYGEVTVKLEIYRDKADYGYLVCSALFDAMPLRRDLVALVTCFDSLGRVLVGAGTAGADRWLPEHGAACGGPVVDFR
jgi:hypothetical protein